MKKFGFYLLLFGIAKKVILFAILTLFVGCASVKIDYTGDESTATTEIAQLLEQTPDSTQYTLLGNATATTDQNVEYAKIKEELAAKAAKLGATDFVITSYQVVPEYSNMVVAESATMSSSGTGSSGIGLLERDFNAGYGQANLPSVSFGNGGVNFSRSDRNISQMGAGTRYIRIVKAEFFRKNSL